MHMCGVWPRAGSEWRAKKVGRLIAAWRPMPMLVCGITPRAGSEWTAKTIGRLIAARRPMPMHVCGITPRVGSEWTAKKNRQANCSVAPDAYAHVRNMA